MIELALRGNLQPIILNIDPARELKLYEDLIPGENRLWEIKGLDTLSNNMYTNVKFNSVDLVSVTVRDTQITPRMDEENQEAQRLYALLKR